MSDSPESQQAKPESPPTADDTPSPAPFVRLLRSPFALMLALVVVSLWAKEFYPLSHYPMYSSHPKAADYYMLSDGENDWIAVEPTFGVRTAKMKKMFKARERAAFETLAGGDMNQRLQQAGQMAGAALLDDLIALPRTDATPELPDRVRLWWTVVTVEHGKIRRRSMLIMERPTQ